MGSPLALGAQQVRAGWPRSLAAVACVVLAGFATSVPTNAQVPTRDGPAPQSCDAPTNSFSLFAEKLGKGRIGYGRSPETASVPGPTIAMTEGDCLQITLVNDTDRRISMHAHGVAYTFASDGTPHNRGCVPPGKALTYVFDATPASVRPDGTVDRRHGRLLALPRPLSGDRSRNRGRGQRPLRGAHRATPGRRRCPTGNRSCW